MSTDTMCEQLPTQSKKDRAQGGPPLPAMAGMCALTYNYNHTVTIIFLRATTKPTGACYGTLVRCWDQHDFNVEHSSPGLLHPGPQYAGARLWDQLDTQVCR